MLIISKSPNIEQFMNLSILVYAIKKYIYISFLSFILATNYLGNKYFRELIRLLSWWQILFRSIFDLPQDFANHLCELYLLILLILLVYCTKNNLYVKAMSPCYFTNVGYSRNKTTKLTLKKLWFFKGSLHAVMVLFRTMAFWRTILCRKWFFLKVLCSRPFVFQICNCQSTSLLIFRSSVIQLHRLSTHSQQVNYFILKFKYKFNCKIVTGFQTNMVLSFLSFFFWSHIFFGHTKSVCSSAKLWKLLSSSPLSK